MFQVCCSGHGKNGTLSALQQSIRPDLITEVHVFFFIFLFVFLVQSLFHSFGKQIILGSFAFFVNLMPLRHLVLFFWTYSFFSNYAGELCVISLIKEIKIQRKEAKCLFQTPKNTQNKKAINFTEP